MFEQKFEAWVEQWLIGLSDVDDEPEATEPQSEPKQPIKITATVNEYKVAESGERPLNACQQAAMNKLVGKPWNIASLVGAAGTGKTYTLLRILKELDIPYLLLAPTHKAKKGLQNSMSTSEVYTVCQALGKQPVINEQGDSVFESQRDGLLGTAPLTVIDEVSMIDAATMDELSKYLGATRYLGLGDICQLPPINERQSSFFEQSSIVAELTQVMRYGGYIADQAQVLRKVVQHNLEVITHPSEPLKVPSIIPDGESIKMISPSHARQLFMDYYGKQNEMGVTDFCKVIAYRNRAVSDYNKVIKSMVYGRTEYPFVEGQPLVATRPVVRYQQVMDSKGRVRSGSSIILNKADETFITSLVESSTISESDIDDYRMSSDGWQYSEIQYLQQHLVGLPCFRFRICGGDLGIEMQAKILTDSSLAAIQKVKDDLWKTKNAATHFYGPAKSRITKYINSFSDGLADPYAITGHMSQGSGFGAAGGAVFLAWHDIMQIPSMLKSDEQKRNHQLMLSQLAYTAATRIQEGGTLYLIQ